jgi:hypothetical protein
MNDDDAISKKRVREDELCVSEEEKTNRYRKIIIDSLLRQVCPNMNKSFIDYAKMSEKLAFHMDMYKTVMIQPIVDVELCSKLEELMIKQITVNTGTRELKNFDFYEARYLVRKRHEMDSDPLRVNIEKVPPQSYMITAYKLKESSKEEHHPTDFWTSFEFKVGESSSDFKQRISRDKGIGDPFAIYIVNLKTKENWTKYSSDELRSFAYQPPPNIQEHYIPHSMDSFADSFHPVLIDVILIIYTKNE